MENKVRKLLRKKLEEKKLALSKSTNICTPEYNPINREIINKDNEYDFYIINLKHRIDRYTNIVKIFKKYNVNLHFLDGIEEKDGRIGCAKSHLYLVNYAKQNNMKYIIVLEDDFLFNEKIEKNEFYKILKFLKMNYDKYYIFNGSPTFWDKRYNLESIKKYKSFDENYYYLNHGQKLTFVIYSSLVYDKILEYNPLTSSLHIDQYIANNIIQIVYNKYICYEINGYSNIVHTHVNYIDYIMKEEQFYINMPIEKKYTIKENYVIGIYGIFINKYVNYYDSFIKNINKYFFPNHKKKFLIVTDQELNIIDNSDTIFVKTPYIGWPYETLYRYKYFLLFDKELINDINVIYFMNSNARCNNIIDDIYPNNTEYIFTPHHGYFNKPYELITYEKNEESTAYVYNRHNLIYVGGGFFGATTNKFIELCQKLDKNITIDEKNNYIACWHDESHLNWFSNIYLKNNCKYLDISFHVPEEIKEHFNKINIYYMKKKNELLNKPLFMEAQAGNIIINNYNN